MTAQRHFIFWSAAFVGFLLFIHVFSNVLLPFVLGIVIAYLLNPVVNRLGRAKIGRKPAALLIVLLFAVVVVTVLTTVLPVICREIIELCSNIPAYIDRLEVLIEPYRDRIIGFLYPEGSPGMHEVIKKHVTATATAAGYIAGGITQGGAAFFHLLGILIITPVVAFFMMKDWPRIVAWVADLIPPQSRHTVVGLFSEIDAKLSAFIRGQITIAAILACAYATALSLLGLKYGFLIGVSAGVLFLIPMVGSLSGLVASSIAAWFQTGDWQFVLMCGGVFVIGNIIENNFLTPKIIGGKVGLHPLWIFFSLMAGASLLGFLGLLVAVPIAAIVSVLGAFAIRQYKSSPFYMSTKNG